MLNEFNQPAVTREQAHCQLGPRRELYSPNMDPIFFVLEMPKESGRQNSGTMGSKTYGEWRRPLAMAKANILSTRLHWIHKSTSIPNIKQPS